MGCFSSLSGPLRSTTVIAFLTLGLLGCGNAPAGASNQDIAQGKPDWTPEPELWYPRAILIPERHPRGHGRRIPAPTPAGSIR